jgi:hypothetical protein
MLKKGQIAGTAVWFVATIIIVLILSLFLYFSSLIGGAKDVTERGASVFAKSTIDLKTNDILMMKSFSAYLLNEQDGRVYDSIKTSLEFDEKTSSLAGQILNFMYLYYSKETYLGAFFVSINPIGQIFTEPSKLRYISFPQSVPFPSDQGLQISFYLNQEKDAKIILGGEFPIGGGI